MKLLVSILIIFLNINTSFSQSEQERYDLSQIETERARVVYLCLENNLRGLNYLACLDEIIVKDPQNMYAYIERGSYYSYSVWNDDGALLSDSIKSTNLKKALLDYDRAVQLMKIIIGGGNLPIYDPYNNDLFRLRVYYKDYSGQIECLDSMYSSNPRDISYPINKSEILFRELNDTVGSINVWNNFIKNYPDYLYAYQALSNIKAKILDFEGAIVVLENASKIDPKNSTVISVRADYREKIGDFIGALRDYNLLININPKESYYFFNRGVVKNNLGDKRGALSDFSEAINLDTNVEKYGYYSMRAGVKMDMKDNFGAIIDYNNAIEIILKDEYHSQNGLSNLYYWRGWAKLYNSDLDGACFDWSKAGELGMEEAYDAIKENCN